MPVGPEYTIPAKTGALSGERAGICSADNGGRNPQLAQGHPHRAPTRYGRLSSVLPDGGEVDIRTIRAG